MEYASFYIIFMSFNLTITLIIMLASCLCCRKRIPKNEFIGVEGMVILKNPEDNIICTNISEIKNSQNDLNVSTTSAADSDKRSSNAPHRSLPDIPLAVATNDTGSELYATVADKVSEKPQGKSPMLNAQKGASVSQHSSISQADDVSSPYARVKASSHDYDKVLSAEHPYAQLTTVTAVNFLNTSPPNSAESFLTESSGSRRGSHQSIAPGPESIQEIPAASAIAGMISASQELPYMTPPIVQQPNFSGDSQDSSKGYTSISVREPLANIIAQTKDRHSRLNRGGSDSHYATVSDDSDEMYAAIEDPKNLGTDIYTSGSETYAQIQPSNAFTVSVEINTSSSTRTHDTSDNSLFTKNPTTAIESTPIPLPVDSLRAQMHSRQASSSSNTSSMGILGSPKPEKRQANSPLPPTPKNIQFNNAISSNLTSANGLVASGRNSISSVIEVHFPLEGSIAEETTPNKKKQGSAKDLEEMYAKVMKKNRLSTSQSNSPVLSRKSIDVSIEADDDVLPDELKINDSDIIEMKVKTSPGKNSIKSASYICDNKYEIVNKRRVRSNSYNSKDHGYETIPADKVNQENKQCQIDKRKSDSYAQITQKERLLAGSLDTETVVCKINVEPGYESLPDQRINNSDPGYETLLKGVTDLKKPSSDYDPNYETLHPPKYVSTNSDDGYAKVIEKTKSIVDEDETIDGYSKVKVQSVDDDIIPGYSRIGEPKKHVINDRHGYASITETSNIKTEEKHLITSLSNNNNNENNSKVMSKSSSGTQYPVNLDEYQNFHSLNDVNKMTAPIALIPSSESIERLINSSSSNHSSTDQLNEMKGSSTSNTISSIQVIQSSNYESLTGSESDPNYESVRYVRTESPYEQIHSFANDITPEDVKTNLTTELSLTNGDISLSITNLKTKLSNPDECGEVDDYFQV